MASTLPGMPIAVGDPGVFICGPADIAPWESEPVPRIPRQRAPQHENVASRPVVRAPRAWIVLGSCGACNVRTERYCDRHDVLWAFRKGTR